MKSTIGALTVLIAAIAHAGPYEDCVISGMKGVASDHAAVLIERACRQKIEDVKKEKQVDKENKFGSPLLGNDYQLVEDSITSHDKHIAVILRNNSTDKTITYATFDVTINYRCDISKRSQSGKTCYNNYKDYSIRYDKDKDKYMAYIRGKSPATYYYKLKVKPNSYTALLIPHEENEGLVMEVDSIVYMNVRKILGRESIWSDWSIGNTAKPESKNPLE